MEKCMKKLEIDPSQPQISRSSLGSITTFRFNQDVVREELVRFIVVDEQPFTFSEKETFKRFIKKSFGDSFQTPSRNTIKANIFKFYKAEKEKLKSLLQNSCGKISLTSNLWSSPTKLRFFCVTAYFIDSTWTMQKRIICFELLEIPHDGETIAQSIFDIINEYGISSKIFSVSLDNASANDNANTRLMRWLPKAHNGKYFKNRCCCHIINLMVKDGLFVCNDVLENVRQTTLYLHSSQKRFQDFSKICTSLSMKPRKPPLDVQHRWNSTYLMLKSILSLKEPIRQYQMGKKLIHTITDDDWEVVELLQDFLKVIYDATLCFSESYYVTSSKVLRHLVDISEVFEQHRHRIQFVEICAEMEAKYKKILGRSSINLGSSYHFKPPIQTKNIKSFLP
ncbi:hypothetical protein GIB67_035147 [Kingdonia uniflora]|uniref:Transposase n=1 Tax=Kingdonia uniflora TaxID=39325 RepID=A0A7J7LDV7_9MAGN|nr:hypothetical protein GIB67_035147 [Kingdonia uniflora]